MNKLIMLCIAVVISVAGTCGLLYLYGSILRYIARKYRFAVLPGSKYDRTWKQFMSNFNKMIMRKDPEDPTDYHKISVAIFCMSIHLYDLMSMNDRILVPIVQWWLNKKANKMLSLMLKWEKSKAFMLEDRSRSVK